MVPKPDFRQWRPVKPSQAIKFLFCSKFCIYTSKSVLNSIAQNQFLNSVDLKDAFLLVPIHKRLRHLLGFAFEDQVFHFKLFVSVWTQPQSCSLKISQR